MSSLEKDIAQLAQQELRLQFDRFDADVAWSLGVALKTRAEAKGVAVAIDIQLHGQPLFFHAMPGTTFDNADWVRRKRNVVMRWQKSSYAVGLGFKLREVSLERYGLPVIDYAPHGGCFPIRLHGMPCIGTIGVSGLPQRDDHGLVVEALAEWLGVPLAEIALDA